MASRWPGLAEPIKAALAFEASVAGGIPIVKTLREGLAGNSIERVYGILNGTCNYILSRWRGGAVLRRMPEGCAAAGLRRGRSDLRHRRFRHRAQARHSRERSPSARRSIAEQAIYVEGIESITPPICRRRTNSAIASSCWASPSGPIRHRAARAPDHGAQIVGDRAGDGRHQRRHHRRRRRPPLTLVGPGAGGERDSLGRRRRYRRRRARHPLAPFGLPVRTLRKTEKAPMQRHEGGYYIRLMARDRPGNGGRIATRLAEQKISLESHRAAPSG
jgi:homoserine dehydrogenase